MKSNVPHIITVLIVASLMLFSGRAFAQTDSESTKADTLKAGIIITDQLNANILQVDTLVVNSGKNVVRNSEGISHHPVVIDFAKKSILEYPNDLKDGEFYYLLIKNINMNLYTVSHSSRDSTITADVSFPPFEVPGLETLIGLIAEIPTSTAKFDASEKINEVSSDSLTKELENYRRFIEKKSRKLQQVNQDIDSLSLSVESYALHYLVEDSTKLKNELRKELNVDRILRRSRVHRKNLKALINTVESKRNEFYDFIDDNETELDKAPELEKISQQLVKLFSAILSGADSVYKSISAKAVTGWLQSVIHLDNNTDRTYQSLPMQLTGDFTELSISIKPKKDEFGLHSYSTQISFPYPNKWYIGLGTSIYGSSLSDENYSTNAIHIDSVNAGLEIVDEESSSWEVGIASLIHLGYKAGDFLKTDFGLHFKIGPALSLTKPVKPRLAAGLGASIGKKQKLTISIISTVGQVERLSNKYNLGENTLDSDENLPSSVTVSKIRLGGGFSVGYLYTF